MFQASVPTTSPLLHGMKMQRGDEREPGGRGGVDRVLPIDLCQCLLCCHALCQHLDVVSEQHTLIASPTGSSDYKRCRGHTGWLAYASCTSDTLKFGETRACKGSFSMAPDYQLRGSIRLYCYMWGVSCPPDAQTAECYCTELCPLCKVCICADHDGALYTLADNLLLGMPPRCILQHLATGIGSGCCNQLWLSSYAATWQTWSGCTVAAL